MRSANGLRVFGEIYVETNEEGAEGSRNGITLLRDEVSQLRSEVASLRGDISKLGTDLDHGLVDSAVLSHKYTRAEVREGVEEIKADARRADRLRLPKSEVDKIVKEFMQGVGFKDYPVIGNRKHH